LIEEVASYAKATPRERLMKDLATTGKSLFESSQAFIKNLPENASATFQTTQAVATEVGEVLRERGPEWADQALQAGKKKVQAQLSKVPVLGSFIGVSA
jgi:hypothetical protein